LKTLKINNILYLSSRGINLDRADEYKIEFYKRRLLRLKNFNWKRYFTQTFIFLLIFFGTFLILSPENLFHTDLWTLIIVGFIVVILVCSLLTPMIYFVYKLKYRKTIIKLDNLLAKSKKEKIRQKNRKEKIIIGEKNDLS
jgi:hypothetical protein